MKIEIPYFAKVNLCILGNVNYTTGPQLWVPVVFATCPHRTCCPRKRGTFFVVCFRKSSHADSQKLQYRLNRLTILENNLVFYTSDYSNEPNNIPEHQYTVHKSNTDLCYQPWQKVQRQCEHQLETTSPAHSIHEESSNVEGMYTDWPANDSMLLLL